MGVAVTKKGGGGNLSSHYLLYPPRFGSVVLYKYLTSGLSFSIFLKTSPQHKVTMAYPMTTQPQAMQGYTTSSSQWSSEVMDCCEDMGICLCGAFVPCILACKVASDYGECCCLPFLGGALLAMRTGMRERYRIPGSICNDCVCLTFCGQCTLCQMARELKARN